MFAPAITTLGVAFAVAPTVVLPPAVVVHCALAVGALVQAAPCVVLAGVACDEGAPWLPADVAAAPPDAGRAPVACPTDPGAALGPAAPGVMLATRIGVADAVAGTTVIGTAAVTIAPTEQPFSPAEHTQVLLKV